MINKNELEKVVDLLKKNNKYKEKKMYKIYNENCLNIIKEIETGTIDLIVTDPPYKTTKYGCAGNRGGMLKSKLSMDGKIFKENNISPNEYMSEFFRVLKEDSHCYVMTNHVNLQEMLNVATNVGFKFIKCLI